MSASRTNIPELIDNEELLDAYDEYIENYDYQKQKERRLNCVKAGYFDSYLDTVQNLKELKLDYLDEETEWKEDYKRGLELIIKLNLNHQSILFLYFKGLNLTEIGKVKGVSKQAIAKSMGRIEKALGS